jgi:hypothetical protein
MRPILIAMIDTVTLTLAAAALGVTSRMGWDIFKVGKFLGQAATRKGYQPDVNPLWSAGFLLCVFVVSALFLYAA